MMMIMMIIMNLGIWNLTGIFINPHFSVWMGKKMWLGGVDTPLSFSGCTHRHISESLRIPWSTELFPGQLGLHKQQKCVWLSYDNKEKLEAKLWMLHLVDFE